jgi:SPP1 family predicted phage head-tail adaptor
MINARKLRHRVTLQKRSQTQDDAGQISNDFADFMTGVRASIEPLSGREYVAAQQVQSEISTRIQARWRPGLDETQRIVHVKGTDSPAPVDVYDIAAVLPDPDSGRHWVTFLCIKRISEGFRRGDV